MQVDCNTTVQQALEAIYSKYFPARSFDSQYCLCAEAIPLGSDEVVLLDGDDNIWQVLSKYPQSVYRWLMVRPQWKIQISWMGQESFNMFIDENMTLAAVYNILCQEFHVEEDSKQLVYSCLEDGKEKAMNGSEFVVSGFKYKIGFKKLMLFGFPRRKKKQEVLSLTAIDSQFNDICKELKVNDEIKWPRVMKWQIVHAYKVHPSSAQKLIEQISESECEDVSNGISTATSIGVVSSESSGNDQIDYVQDPHDWIQKLTTLVKPMNKLLKQFFSILSLQSEVWKGQFISLGGLTILLEEANKLKKKKNFIVLDCIYQLDKRTLIGWLSKNIRSHVLTTSDLSEWNNASVMSDLLLIVDLNQFCLEWMELLLDTLPLDKQRLYCRELPWSEIKNLNHPVLTKIKDVMLLDMFSLNPDKINDFVEKNDSLKSVSSICSEDGGAVDEFSTLVDGSCQTDVSGSDGSSPECLMIDSFTQTESSYSDLKNNSSQTSTQTIKENEDPNVSSKRNHSDQLPPVPPPRARHSVFAMSSTSTPPPPPLHHHEMISPPMAPPPPMMSSISVSAPPPPPPPPPMMSPISVSAPPPPPPSPPMMSPISVSAPPPPPPPPSMMSPMSPPPPPLPMSPMSPLPLKPKVTPSVPMKPFHWNVVPPIKVAGTVWSSLDELPVVDASTLEALFQNKKESSQQQQQLFSPIGRSVLDPQRSNNISIMLATMKIELNEIKRAILECDCAALSLSHLNSIIQFSPTAEEIKLLSEETELGKAEQFLSMLSTIDRLTERCKAMIFIKNMNCNELVSKYDDMATTLEAIKNNKSLKKVLSFCLSVGNYLNGSSYRGGAYGFALEDLLKLKSIKSVSDDVPSLLHYVHSVCGWEFGIDLHGKSLFKDVEDQRNVVVEGFNELNKKWTNEGDNEDVFILKIKKFITENQQKITNLLEAATKTNETATRVMQFFGFESNEPNELFDILLQFDRDMSSAKQDVKVVEKKAFKVDLAQLTRQKSRLNNRNSMFVGDLSSASSGSVEGVDLRGRLKRVQK